MSHAMHAEKNRPVDSHGNLTDGDAFRALLEMRAEYRAKIAALMTSRVSKEGREIIQEYLGGDEANAHDTSIEWWLEGCENHENGSDA